MILATASGTSCQSAPPPTPPMDTGDWPMGSRVATVKALQDGCALLLPQLMPGAQLHLVLQPDGAGLDVIVPNTTLPRLSAMSVQADRFTTATYVVPISAGGQCTARRTQYYEGRAASATEYQVLFHSDDDMPMGTCGSTPLPCMTVATLSIPFCPATGGCAGPDM